MRSSTLVFLATLGSSTAIAAESSDHLRIDLAIGAASQPREGTLTTGQINLAWEFRPGASLEFWQARGSVNEHRPPTLEEYWSMPPGLFHLDIRRVGGFGLRYDFNTRAGSRWQPFVRAGWAHVSGAYNGPDGGVGPDGEFVGSRREFPISDNAPYVAAGSAYNFTDNWNASLQVQHIAADFRTQFDTHRTELLFGIGYRY